MSKLLNINASEVVEFTNKLEKMHRSALPVSVRGALNDAAFDMKKNQVEKKFTSKFTIRKNNFIRSHTAFNKSKNTFNLREMKSECGVIKDKSKAGDQLETQEIGGIIKNRDFIALNESRVGKNEAKLISKRNYLKNLGRKPVKRKTKEDFFKTAIKLGKGANIIFDGLMFRIDSVSKKGLVKETPLYDYKNNRSVSIQKAPFIKPAGDLSAKKIPGFFIKRAKKKINDLAR